MNDHLSTEATAAAPSSGPNDAPRAAHDVLQRRYAALKAIAGTAVVISGPDGAVTEPQPDWQALTGLDEHRAGAWRRAIHPDDLDGAVQRWEQATRGAPPLPFHDEYRVRCEPGGYRSFCVTSTPVFGEDGGVVEWISLYADVSERRAALQELNDLKAAIDEHAIVAITDARGRITSVNDKFCAISQYAREELLGKDHRIINSGHHPKDYIRGIWRTISDGRVWKGELKNRAKDGTHYWVDTTIVPYLGEDGQPVQYIAIRADITERKEAERALHRAQADLQRHATTLEETVAIRTAALRETIGELEAFSYSISHDMRAPLRAMQSFATILGEECAGEVSAEGKEYIRRIIAAAARLDGLIKDVLTYSRVTRTDLPLHPVDLGALLQDVIGTYPAFQAPAARVELVGPFPHVQAIPAVLTQCISNLLGNAVKFVEPGARPHVKVWAVDLPCEARVRVHFEDNGVGIDPDAHDSIFGIFQRLSQAYEGTGIGLAIVKKGAERLGGSVGLASTPGKGSTFWLDLQKQPPVAR